MASGWQPVALVSCGIVLLVTLGPSLPGVAEFVASDRLIEPFVLDAAGNKYRGDAKALAVFDGFEWAAKFGNNWWLPITVAIIYMVSMPFLKAHMDKRDKIHLQTLVTAWNAGLSLFSTAGFLYLFPALLSVVVNDGFQASVCKHPALGAYGHGAEGFFVACFIFSKLAEIVDTFFLLIRKSPVIFLHWYHHVTVMLFCWHTYSLGTGYAGLWFAAMNYGVHSLMYAYYALMAWETTRQIVSRYSVFLTGLQILQMVMGMVVLGKSVHYQLAGQPCYINRSTQLLGLLMYASYFVLFAKLFLDYYVFGGKDKKNRERQAKLALEKKKSK